MADSNTPHNQASIRAIERLVGRLARRVRLSRALDRAFSGACFGILLAALALALHKTGWIDAGPMHATWAVAAALPLVLAFIGLLGRLDRIELARRLDEAHGLHDRLSTALSLAQPRRDSLDGTDGTAAAPDAFARAQIEDASRFIAGVDVRRAAPLRRPADLGPLALFAAGLVGLWFVPVPDHDHPLPPPLTIQYAPVLDAATVAIERDRLEALRRELAGSNDPEALELLDEIEALLAAVDNREISERQFLEKLDEIEQKFFEGEDTPEVEKFADALQKAAQELQREARKELAAQPELQEVIDAFARRDLEAAAKAVEALTDKLTDEKLSPKDAEQLAKLLEQFADKIDPADPRLQELMEKYQKEIEQLSKELEGNENASADAREHLERLEKEFEKAKRESQIAFEKEGARRLERLTKEVEELAEDLRKQAELDKNNRGRKNPDDPDYRQEIGRKGNQARRQLEESARDQRANDARQEARRQLEELREALKRSERPGEQSQQERGEQVRDFLDRARGQQDGRPQGGQQGQQDGDPQGQQDADPQGPQDSSQPGTSEGSPQDGDQPGNAGDDRGEGGAAGDQRGQGASETGPDSGGTREDDTRLDSKRVREQQRGDQSAEGPSRSEVIKAASEEGFATTEYKDVFVDYDSVVEEVMERERVPDGYRYYIKRYFQLIKPQQ